MSLSENLALLTKVTIHQLVVIFSKEIMDGGKHLPGKNITPFSFIGLTTNQERTGKIQGYWDPEKLAAVITLVVLPV